MRMCINKRVVVGLAVVSLVLFALSPRLLSGLAPVLIMAACPLSMLLMMRGMSGRDDQAPTAAGDERQLRELEEEVNRLKVELALRSEDKPA